jgi:predicted aminopeptidase
MSTRLRARTRRFPAPTVGLLAALATALAGCDGLTYVTHVTENQLAIQGNTEPIDAVLASNRLTDEQAARLELAVAARDYAAEVIGLDAGDSYTTFYDSADAPLAWNLSAARQDALTPMEWTFPVIGRVPYLAFFEEGYLRSVEADLQADGYDTFTYELDAYSTLGLFDDPIRSAMLQRGDLSLVETIIHELLHNTIYRPNATVFNESLATFVGRQGAVDFLVDVYGEDSGWPEIARDYYADLDTVNTFLLALYAELEAYYATGLPPETLVAGREAIFAAARERFENEILPTLNYPDAFAGYADLPTNNAWLLGHYRYNLSLDQFEQVYAATGQDWPAAMAVFEAAAAAAGDPFAYLADWLAEHGGQA